MVAANKVVISGTLPGGEVWSVGAHFVGAAGVPTAQSFAQLDAWAGRIAALNAGNVVPAGVRNIMSTAVAVTSVRCELLNGDASLAQAAERGTPDPRTGVGTPTKPLQTSLVASLFTGRPGRSYRGRMYWPALGLGLGATDGRVSNATCQAVATETAQFLRNVGAQAGFESEPGFLVVCSQTLNVNTPVTEIRVGDVPDVQRRRRDALTEGIFSAPMPAAAT